MSVADTETSVSTRDRILDAAETLFIEHGFAGTSVRAIATEAGVNLAATNYHFGSKKGLFSAVFQRRVQPINEERLQRLSRLQKEVQVGKRKLTIRLVLECFFEPLRHVDPGIPALVGRMHGEPASLTRPILEEAFLEGLTRFPVFSFFHILRACSKFRRYFRFFSLERMHGLS